MNKTGRASVLSAIAVCVTLLLLRSWFFLAWEESYFHSDQAVIGLMAKHLAEGRSFPLFFYGQEYMLGVESWWAAPFIGLFGPSVAALRIAMIAMNLVTGVLLLRLLIKDAALGVWPAVVASAPFWIAPVILASSLVEAQGGNIEPFLWTLILWIIRWRPLLLGVVLAIAVMNREFSAYAAPMLVITQLLEVRTDNRTLRAAALNWTAAAAAFLIVFTSVQLLKPYADLMGPGTAGVVVQTQGQDNIALATQRVRLNVTEMSVRFRDLVTDFVPTLFGFKAFQPVIVAVATDVAVGWRWPGFVVAVFSAMALGLLLRETRAILLSNRYWLFPVYLIGVGTIAALAYPLARPLSMYTMRYGLLVLYLPIGLAALMVHADRGRALRSTAAMAIAVFVACSVTDHVRVLAHAFDSPPPTPVGDVVQRLLDRRVHVALGDYWHSYNVTYLSGERIKVAATNFERILEYKAIVGRPVDEVSPGGVVVIQKEPCEAGGEQVGGMYLCDWK